MLRFLLPLLISTFILCRFSTLFGSLSQKCIRTNGSRPLIERRCHGFGFDNNSETEPCDRPRTRSPNNCENISFMVMLLSCFLPYSSCLCGLWEKLEVLVAQKHTPATQKTHKFLALTFCPILFSTRISLTLFVNIKVSMSSITEAASNTTCALGPNSLNQYSISTKAQPKVLIRTLTLCPQNEESVVF